MRDEAIDLAKKELRATFRKRRKAFAPTHPRAAFALCDLFLKGVTLPPSMPIGMTVAFPDEIDPMPLALALNGLGHPLALPCIEEKNGPLVFRAWSACEPLTRGPLGVLQPLATAPVVDPGALLVPIVAFDRAGNRIGLGGGYYDRTLSKLRQEHPTLAIGLAFSVQETPSVPIGSQDVAMDLIVTERDLFLCGDPATIMGLYGATLL